MQSESGKSPFQLWIILAMLVLLAGFTIPQYHRTDQKMKVSALNADLAAMRQAIKDYVADHHGLGPCEGDSATETQFVRALTLRTEADGRVETAGPYGPYLLTGIPENPFNGMRTIRVVTQSAPPVADNTTGWIYHVRTRTLMANTTATGLDGTPLSTH